jgi:hypothetical protein
VGAALRGRPLNKWKTAEASAHHRRVRDLSFDQTDFFFLMHWPAATAAFLAALASALVG